MEARRRQHTGPPHTRATHADTGPGSVAPDADVGTPAPSAHSDHGATRPPSEYDRYTVEPLWIARQRVRAAVSDTLDSGSRFAGRLCGADVDAADDRAGAQRPFRGLSAMMLRGWLSRAQQRRPDGRLGADAASWIASHLGPSGDGIDRAAAVLLATPVTSDAAVDEIERERELGAEFLAVLVWLTAAVVALLDDADVRRLDIDDFGSEADAERVRRRWETPWASA